MRISSHRSLALLFAVIVACTGDRTSTPEDDCPDGQSRNPITLECEAVAGDETDADGATSSPPDTGETPANNTTSVAPDSGRDVAPPTPDAPDVTAEPDMQPQAGELVRFVAIGDTGTGSDDQRLVGQSIGTVCTSLGGCDFGLLLGDNFYDSGVDSVDDSLFVSRFVDPYGHLGFPFWAVLGNHDLGGDGLGVDLDPNKANYQIDYSELNPQWRMPARYYSFTEGPLFFVGLNTTAIFFGNDDDQREDVPLMLAGSGDRWKIAFGHHPYFSNGPHGNAGSYEGLPFVPVANGAEVKSFFDDTICGEFDLYLCGHDHSRQDLVPTCDGTQFVVSGAGAKTTELEGDNDTHFEMDTEGFLLIEATDPSLTIQFYDKHGTKEHERAILR